MAPESPSAELSLLLAIAAAGSKPSSQIPTLAGNVADWELTRDLAYWHGLTPLLHWHLEQHQHPALDTAALSDLANRFRQGSRFAFALAREMVRLLTHLSDAGIPALGFKGPVLAQAAYDDLSLRPYSDLDILVNQSDVPHALQLLQDLGYRPNRDRSQTGQAALLANHWEIKLHRPGTNLVVELQWRFTSRFFRFPLALADVWSRRRTMTLLGATIPVLSPEDRLLVLSVHGARHGWTRLIWLGDILHTPGLATELDWALLQRRAQAMGVRRMLNVALWLTQRLASCGESGLDVVATDDSDLDSARLAASVWNHLAQGRAAEPSTAQKAFFRWSARERISDKAYLLLGAIHRLATPVAADRAFGLPSRLHFVYYLYRPLRLAATFAHTLVRRLTRGVARRGVPVAGTER